MTSNTSEEPKENIDWDDDENSFGHHRKGDDRTYIRSIVSSLREKEEWKLYTEKFVQRWREEAKIQQIQTT